MEQSRWPNIQQKLRIFEQVGYTPHGSQLPVHTSESKVLLIAGGERAGKSQVSSCEVLARSPWCYRSGNIAIVAQEYDETRSECEYLIDYFNELHWLTGKPSQPRQGKWQWEIVGPDGNIHFETVSLNRSGVRELTGRGKAYDIVLLVEAGLISYDAFLGALGRVSESRGLVILSGTLWDNFGWYADLYKSFAGPNVFDGSVFALPTWDNLAKFPGGENDGEIQRLKDTLPEDEFARRVAAKLVPSPARIYPEFRYDLHVSDEVKYNPDLPVFLAVDPGYRPSHYAVLALQVAEETIDDKPMEVVYQIDEIWEHDKTHHDVISMCRDREWWTGVTEAVGGHETKQHQATKSTQEVWRNVVGTQEGDPENFIFTVFNAGKIVDGIIRVKTFLSDPGTKRSRYYCAPRNTGTQDEFQRYKRKTNSKDEVTSEEPEDRNNDAMDALRNFLVHRYGLVESTVTYGVTKAGKRRGTSRG